MNYSLIIELAKRDFIERYSGSALGFIWSFIYPLITILIYMIVFGNLMGATQPGDSSVRLLHRRPGLDIAIDDASSWKTTGFLTAVDTKEQYKTEQE